ncbi:hypothetical protein [Metamycoplasma hominis]|uniref:hypothetical protein n=1 Tax=Metamycoplasma hominis TaxID=2098 RepID=UPI001F3322D7|nr:hypothetical protein [Metamycoplasma hominis]
MSLFIAKSNWWLANSSPIVPADKLTIAMPFFCLILLVWPYRNYIEKFIKLKQKN